MARLPHNEITDNPTGKKKSASLSEIYMKNGYYTHDRPEIVNEIPENAARILDIGCGAGRLGYNLRQKRPDLYIAGIEINPNACKQAKAVYDQVYCMDVEKKYLPTTTEPFDCLIFADLLEHLRDPWTVFAEFLNILTPSGTVIVSLPNIRNIQIVRHLLINGRWEYDREGILDKTHLHFFTRREFLTFMNQQNVSCRKVTYLGDGSGFDLEEFSGYGIAKEEFPELCASQLLYTGIYQCADHDEPLEEVVQFPLQFKPSDKGISFGSGFSEDTDGKKWIGPKSLIYISPEQLLLNNSVSFTLSGSALSLLPETCLTVTIYYNDFPVDTILLSDPNGFIEVSIPLFPCSKQACIRFEPSSFFKPSLTGESTDSRVLSAVLSNLTLSERNELSWGPGFYREEENKAWIGTEGRLDIRPDLNGAERCLSFKVIAPLLQQADCNGLQVSFYYNDLPFLKVHLTPNHSWEKIIIPVHASKRITEIRIVPDQTFQPSEISASDDKRLLSVQLFDVSLKKVNDKQ